MSVAPALLALIVTAASGQPLPAGERPPPEQPPQSAPQTQAPMSERQKERITRQERMIACNREGRDAGLRGARRQDFVRDCLKEENAAVGGGQEK